VILKSNFTFFGSKSTNENSSTRTGASQVTNELFYVFVT